MPISEDNYNKFEKPKEDANGGVIAPSPVEPVNHNVNQWHWESFDCTTFAKKRLTKYFMALEIPVGEDKIKITSTTYEGDAYINQRKGKIFCGFEFHVNLEYKVTVGETELTGKAVLPDVCLDDDADITAVKTEGGSDDQRTMVNGAMRKVGIQHLRGAVNILKKELADIAKNPAGFDPHAEDVEDDEGSSSD
jgi:activator of HSP90 ATPase